MVSSSPKPYAAAGGPVDQVLRLEAFRRRHPSVDITSPRQNESRAWKAIIDTDHGYNELNRFDLRTLLDNLEEMFGE